MVAATSLKILRYDAKRPAQKAMGLNGRRDEWVVVTVTTLLWDLTLRCPRDVRVGTRVCWERQDELVQGAVGVCPRCQLLLLPYLEDLASPPCSQAQQSCCSWHEL